MRIAFITEDISAQLLKGVIYPKQIARQQHSFDTPEHYFRYKAPRIHFHEQGGSRCSFTNTERSTPRSELIYFPKENLRTSPAFLAVIKIETYVQQNAHHTNIYQPIESVRGHIFQSCLRYGILSRPIAQSRPPSSFETEEFVRTCIRSFMIRKYCEYFTRTAKKIAKPEYRIDLGRFSQ